MYGTGKKKTSISRVFIKENGNNIITINSKSLQKYFPEKKDSFTIFEPIKLLQINNLDFKITVKGGGKKSQAEAIKFGISKALLNYNENYKILLKQQKLLTRDTRIVERKKYGKHKARKSHQYSKR